MTTDRHELIRGILERYWLRNDFEIRELQGDASTRKYYRSLCRGDTLIVMDRAESYNPHQDPFIVLTYYLQRHCLPVPAILRDCSDEGILLLEDLGDRTLQNEYDADPDSAMTNLYDQVFQILVRMHTTCIDKGIEKPDAFNLRFDFAKLRWELDFFLTHFVSGYRAIKLTPAESVVLNRCFDFICSTLEKEPTVFTHRDFHSRNLMVRKSRVIMIDFQDARLGPSEYDLASLLRDAYVILPEVYINKFLKRYYDHLDPSRSRHHRRWIFSLMCLQRNIKAAGTFGYQASVRGNRNYLQYVKTLEYHISTELDQLNRMRGHKENHLPDERAFEDIIGRIFNEA
ncbi:phosphotransferase [bacterium]|nr:phosphotransferase [candidate division CSSED10-310 bacterium]